MRQHADVLESEQHASFVLSQWGIEVAYFDKIKAFFFSLVPMSPYW